MRMELNGDIKRPRAVRDGVSETVKVSENNDGGRTNGNSDIGTIGTESTHVGKV